MNKCFEEYEMEYQKLPFEKHQASLRRIQVIGELKKNQPAVVTEVGCGAYPLFCDYSDFEKMIVIEPGDKFAENARRLADNNVKVNSIQIINQALENVRCLDTSVDMMILSGLLHEVPSVPDFLRQAAAVGGEECDYLIVVPNALSFHRQLGFRSGIIDNFAALSEQQKKLQQYRTYTLASLTEELERAGFILQSEKSIIFKPFTHSQMEQLIESEILSEQQVYTLCEMVDLTPDIGSELLVTAQYKGVM